MCSDMEENNSIIIKALAAVLIVILGLNVYRTESTIKKLNDVSDAVDLLSDRVDSLVMPGIAAIGNTVTAPKMNGKDVDNLSRSVSDLQKRVKVLELVTIPARKGNDNASSKQVASPTSAGTRVVVTAKVKVENRYADRKVVLPEVTTGPTGKVVVNVGMDRIGIVSSASIGQGTTITDEDVLDLCKEAALKTQFSFNPDAPETSRGTITYTFTAK